MQAFPWPLHPEMEGRWAGHEGRQPESAQEGGVLRCISKATSGQGRARADPPREPLKVTGEPKTRGGGCRGARRCEVLALAEGLEVRSPAP